MLPFTVATGGCVRFLGESPIAADSRGIGERGDARGEGAGPGQDGEAGDAGGPSACTHFVRAGGSDGADCRTRATACSTLNAAFGKLSAGSVLCIEGGTSEADPAAVWNQQLGIGPASPRGSVTAWITVQPTPGTWVRLQPSILQSGTHYVLGFFEAPGAGVPVGTGCVTGRCSTTAPQHIAFKGEVIGGARTFIIDARHMTVGSGIQLGNAGSGTLDAAATGPHHLRFVNLEVRNSQDQGVLATGDYVQLENVEIHSNGRPSAGHGTHGLSFCGKRWLVKGGRIHHNFNSGVQTWCGNVNGTPNSAGGISPDSSNNWFENVEVDHNGLNDCAVTTCGYAGEDTRTCSGSLCSPDYAFGLWIACGQNNQLVGVNAHDNVSSGVFVHSGAWGTLIKGGKIVNNNNAGGSQHGAGGLTDSDDSFEGCGGAYEEGAIAGTSKLTGARASNFSGNTLSGNRGGNLAASFGACATQIYSDGSTATMISGNTCP